ncbi:MAG: UDP-2,3-diacylglucosamine diphosphatase [Proteobacteria bacterium]|nr:MAG: UDP-2,3-diacylglucosamine diphosphatase [Pseudomonadota bacterium]
MTRNKILFIADLHLCKQHPEITDRFIRFCRDQASQADKLYILGDLFEYWLGDDVIDEVAQVVKNELQRLGDLGCQCYFMAGNRDFLLGHSFADSCGLKLLQEPLVIQLYNRRALLVHGDAECTDDVVYQKARQQLRNPQWQQDFLSKPIAERITFAQQARQKSQDHTGQVAMTIMDVNQQAIEQLFKQHEVDLLIHGHTHRPAVHQHGTNTRIVMGDWHHQTHFLETTPKLLRLINY